MVLFKRSRNGAARAGASWNSRFKAPAEILKRLRGELERWIESTHDLGRTPEPQEWLDLLERRARESDEKFKK